MRKFITQSAAVLLLMSAGTGLLAQNKCGCIPQKQTVQKLINFCSFGDSSEAYYRDVSNPNSFDPSEPNYRPDLGYVPDLNNPILDADGNQVYNSVYVGVVYGVLTYTITTCGNAKALAISSFQLVDHRNEFLARNPPHFVGGSWKLICEQPYSSFQDAYRIALSGLAATVGTGIFEVAHEKGCMAEVEVRWPADTVYFSSGDGGTPKKIPLASYQSWSLLPCEGSTCCKFTYTYQNGTLVVIDPPSEQNCDAPVRLDSHTLPYIDGYDASGKPKRFYGTILSQGPCRPACAVAQELRYAIDADPNTAKYKSLSDVASYMVWPEPVKNNLVLEQVASVHQVMIIDALGRPVKTLTSADARQIDFSGFATGIYYVQLYLTNGEVRMIKLLKE